MCVSKCVDEAELKRTVMRQVRSPSSCTPWSLAISGLTVTSYHFVSCQPIVLFKSVGRMSVTGREGDEGGGGGIARKKTHTHTRRLFFPRKKPRLLWLLSVL